MKDISAVGVKVNVLAIPTYPQGFEITELADDADPLDFPEITIAEHGMGVNGDMVVWSKPVPLEVILNVIPNSEADKNLAILLNMNRVAKGKVSAQDIITLISSYPDGSRKVLSNGKILAGQVANSVSSNGRIKTKQYRFVFENMVN